MNLLLLGATGLVGGQVLQQTLADPRVEHVIALTRRALPAHAKLSAPRSWISIICRRRRPGGVPMRCCARLARRSGRPARATHSVASIMPFRSPPRVLRARTARLPAYSVPPWGADPASRLFYNRVKGELERDLAAVGFPSLALVRPGVIAGKRNEHRPAEQLLLRVLHSVKPLLPRGWRPSPAPAIAQAMLDAAISAQPGVRIVDSAALS